METTVQNHHLNSVDSWNNNAVAWDELMGEGSPFQLQVVDRALAQLLPPIGEKTKILEVACGNGFLARRFARLGADVCALDSSQEAITLAKQRTPPELISKINYRTVDATQKESYDGLVNDFDLAVSNMSFMDISDIQPIFEGVSSVLKPGGAFIITQTHPCFEKAVGPLFHETDEGDRKTLRTNGVKVCRYLTSSVMRVKAVPTLPKEHLFFHRSLSTLCQVAFQAGFVIDALEEVAFPQQFSLTEHVGWHLLTDIPVIIGLRFRK